MSIQCLWWGQEFTLGQHVRVSNFDSIVRRLGVFKLYQKDCQDIAHTLASFCESIQGTLLEVLSPHWCSASLPPPTYNPRNHYLNVHSDQDLNSTSHVVPNDFGWSYLLGCIVEARDAAKDDFLLLQGLLVTLQTYVSVCTCRPDWLWGVPFVLQIRLVFHVFDYRGDAVLAFAIV